MKALGVIDPPEAVQQMGAAQLAQASAAMQQMATQAGLYGTGSMLGIFGGQVSPLLTLNEISREEFERVHVEGTFKEPETAIIPYFLAKMNEQEVAEFKREVENQLVDKRTDAKTMAGLEKMRDLAREREDMIFHERQVARRAFSAFTPGAMAEKLPMTATEVQSRWDALRKFVTE